MGSRGKKTKVVLGHEGKKCIAHSHSGGSFCLSFRDFDLKSAVRKRQKMVTEVMEKGVVQSWKKQ